MYVWNSLGSRRHDVASVTIETNNVHVINSTSGRVKYQINPVWLDNGTIDTSHYTVWVQVCIPQIESLLFENVALLSKQFCSIII